MHFTSEEAWELKPRKLTPDEAENPETVIRQFFEYAHLPQVRSYMWESVKTMVTGTYAQLKSRERYNLIYFYEQMERLMEAIYIVHDKDNESTPS